jgi:diguanylate cyclase (GGDEF)-like protein
MGLVRRVPACSEPAADRRIDRPARPLAPDVSWTFLACTISLALVYAAGVLGEAVYPLMLGGSCIAVLVGVRRNRPVVRWYWWAFISSLVLWTAAGGVRESVQATGVLDSSRSFLPDVFALPAYGVLAVALSGLLRLQRSGHRDRGAWLDGVVVALAALLLAWIFALGPQLSSRDASLPAAIAVAIYPPLSALLVAISCRLAFGATTRSASHQMVFVGAVCLLVGDIAFAMEEVGTLSVGRVFELPFLVAGALLGGAALHPSMRHLNRPVTHRTGVLTRTRIATLAVALVLPSLIVAVLPRTSTTARVFLGAILVALAVASTLRLVFTLRDQSRFEAQLVYQATHDELTGLPNRTHALAHIEQCLRRGDGSDTPERLAVMFADVDEFKLVNDSMGHAIGDELLITAAERLTATVRDGDFVARISGDEFLIVCQGVELAEARMIAERVRFAFSQPFELSSGRVYATTSIGVAMNDRDSDAAGLVRDADTAMYRSKFTGRDSITFFDVAMRERVERRVALERMLRTALERGEIVPYFQPLVTLPAGQVEGFEVLARWHHADGWIHPVEFVPVAEESGLIVALGATILDQSCRQLAAWRRELPGAEHAYVSVNLSPRQILESDIVDTVAEVLGRWELPGSALCLEITENVMLEDTVETQAVLHALRHLGVSLSMDDFGTGFSSLSYLKKYPVSRVKIDKMFVDGLDEADADDSLVAAIIAMASALGLTTIAEGVERGAQASRLFELGCTGAQGYYFAEALDPAHVPGVVLPLGFTPEPRHRERRGEELSDDRTWPRSSPPSP